MLWIVISTPDGVPPYKWAGGLSVLGWHYSHAAEKKFFWGIGRINAIYHLPTKIDPKYYGSPVFRGGSSLSFKPHGRVFVECYPRPRSDRHVGVGPNFQIQPSFGPETVWRRSHWKWLVRLVFSGEGHGRRTTDRPGWCFQGGKKNIARQTGILPTNARVTKHF